jgi:SNF2 family DNA or RNA helicase
LQDPPEDAVVTTCGHVFCYQCVHESLTSDGHVCPYALCGKKLSFRSVFTPAVLKLCTSPKLEFDEKPSCSTAADKPSSICESSYISSKIRAAVEILNSIIKTPALKAGDTTESILSMAFPVKAIVFSQWTGMLDLLQLSLNRNDIQFRRLDGSMCLNLREQQVNEFKTDPKVLSCILSFLSSYSAIFTDISQVNTDNNFYSSGESNAYVTEGWQSWFKHGSCLPCDYA